MDTQSGKRMVVGRVWGRWLLLAAYFVLFAALTMVWQDPDMRRWLEPQRLGRLGRDLLALPFGPMLVLGGYVLAVVLAMPVALLITAGALIFGPWPGMAYALAGMVSGAVVTYGIGRLTGARVVDQWSNHRIRALSHALKRRGLWAVAFIRFVPIAPFVVVNMAAGALRVPLRDFVLGSVLGLLPGTVIISLFTDRLAAAVQDPGVGTVTALVVLTVAAGVALWVVKRRLQRVGPA